LKQADVEDGLKPSRTAAENTELREAKKRIRFLERLDSSLGSTAPAPAVTVPAEEAAPA
jgi:transposase